MADVIGDDDGWDAVQAALDALTPKPARAAPVSRLGWASVPVMHEGAWQMHSVPVDDVQPHQLAGACPCGAREDPYVDNVFEHNSFDGREKYERGRAKH